MIDFKNVIADELKKVTNIESAGEYIEVPANKEMGDLSLPCFKLAKEMKKAPQMIANEIKEKLDISEDIVSKIEVVNGFLNFYLDSKNIVQNSVEKILEEKEKYGEMVARA